MHQPKDTSRRQFFRQVTQFSAGLAIVPSMPAVLPDEKLPERKNTGLSLHVFSKHLQFLAYPDMAETAAELGFDGVDLTVRDGGHVLPENVKEDLPKAVEAIKSAGLLADMMATNVNNAWDRTYRDVLQTASKLGIKWYRLGYFRLDPQRAIPEELAEFNRQMQQLAKLNQALGLQGGYQNHAGNYVGSNIWEIWHLLEGTPADALGCQYDIRHAVVEGGLSWPVGLRLIRPKINCIVLKDFIWKQEGTQWKVVNVPLGQGMVDFKTYFQLLKSYEIDVPVSIHFEYDLGGAEHGQRKVTAADRKRVFEAMKRDVQFARQQWDAE
ncbi:MAG: sugar phosphate isomerase/epimerase [Lewinella sp.]|nr:sugar phosphate isomerase/epimerase [Lewinella sp.]